MSSVVVSSLLILALVVYMIVRQFQERSVRFPAILLIPALVAYYSYTNIVAQLANPIINPILIVVSLVIGMLLGCLIGWYRGGLARMRLDGATGTVFAKASALSQVIWSAFLILKIAITTAFYMGLAHTSMLFALMMAVMTTLFLGNMLAEKVCLVWRSQQYQVVSRKQVPLPQQRW